MLLVRRSWRTWRSWPAAGAGAHAGAHAGAASACLLVERRGGAGARATHVLLMHGRRQRRELGWRRAWRARIASRRRALIVLLLLLPLISTHPRPRLPWSLPLLLLVIQLLLLRHVWRWVASLLLLRWSGVAWGPSAPAHTPPCAASYTASSPELITAYATAAVSIIETSRSRPRPRAWASVIVTPRARPWPRSWCRVRVPPGPSPATIPTAAVPATASSSNLRVPWSQGTGAADAALRGRELQAVRKELTSHGQQLLHVDGAAGRLLLRLLRRLLLRRLLLLRWCAMLLLPLLLLLPLRLLLPLLLLLWLLRLLLSMLLLLLLLLLLRGRRRLHRRWWR